LGFAALKAQAYPRQNARLLQKEVYEQQLGLFADYDYLKSIRFE